MSRTTPLSDTKIKQSKPKEKEYHLSDGFGLQLRIKPSGTKSWVLKYYKPFSKKRSNISLGNYPDVSLAKARKIREEYKSLLASNIDPKEHREQEVRQQVEANSNTLKHMVDLWLEVKKTKVSNDHAIDIYRSFELHIFPKLGSLPIHKINAPIAIDALKPVQKRGHLDLVKRLAQRLNEVMNFAVNCGMLTHNCLSGITHTFQSVAKQNYATLKPEEIPQLVTDVQKANINHMTRLLILWQLHTMVRPGEAAGTRWDEIDTDQKLWRIPAERMKKKKPHAVPLTDQALELLDELQGMTGHREFVFFSARSKSKHTSESSANVALKRMGYKDRLVAHGMRALASTTLNEYGHEPELIEAALAHVDKNEVRAAYNRAEYIERRRPLMAWWSNHIEFARTGNLNQTNIIPIKKHG